MIAYAPGTTACVISDDRIPEASGMVASDREDGVLFVHNDSGDRARFFALGPDCRTRGTFDVAGVGARDWEDIARGPGHVLWLGDIGDNRAVRGSVLVRRVAEPLSSPSRTLTSTDFRLRYPDGPHDAETLLADPLDGRLYVLTKSLLGEGTLYAAPLPLVHGAFNALTRLETVHFPLGSLAPTGGDISPDGRRLVIRTYGDAFESPVPTGPGIRLAHVFAHGPGTRVDLPAEQQGEAIAYSRDGRSLLTTSEGEHPPVHVMAPSRTEAPVARAPARRGRDLSPYLLGSGVLVVVAVLLGFRRRRRRSMPWA